MVQLSLPFSGPERPPRWAAFFEELLGGYNMLADQGHQLGAEALERVKG